VNNKDAYISDLSFKPHENARVRVVNLITQSLKTVLESRCRVSQTLDCYILRRLLEEPEGITILMPQEVYVGGEKWAVDTLLGDVAVIEYKGREQEFEEAKRSARGKYWNIVSRRKYYIVTAWEKWRIYRVTKDDLELVMEGDKDKAREVLETQILSGLEALKIPPLPENIEALYKLDYEKYLDDLKQAFRKVKDDPMIKPLYEAYRSIIQFLYGEADEGFYEDLFIRHTYMQMAVIASLTIALGKRGLPEELRRGQGRVLLEATCNWLTGVGNPKDAVISYCRRTYGFNSHSLRYAFITYMLSKGVNPSIVAKVTGHRSLEHILRYTETKTAEGLLRELP